MPAPKHSVNVMLSTQDRDDADLLAARWETSRSGAVRKLIRAGARHVLKHQPTCASCEQCRVPAAVQYQGEPHDPSTSTG